MNEEIKASVDSRQFHELAMDYRGASVETAHGKYNALIAHINAWGEQCVSAAVQEAYEKAAIAADQRACEYDEDVDLKCVQDAIRALKSTPASRAMLPVVPSLRSDTVTDSRLTDEQIDRQWAMSCTYGGVTTQQFVRHFARALLALATERSDGTCQGASHVAGWVSVEERLPEECVDVAVTGPAFNDYGKGRYVECGSLYQGTFYDDNGNDLHSPSHWCALPPAPASTPTQQNQQEQS